MKKILSIILALTLVLSLAACGGKTEPEVVEPEREPEEIVVEDKVEEPEEVLTVAQQLNAMFQEKAAASTDVVSLAKELVSHEIIPFMGDAMPIEPGLLNGFGEKEITGFKTGAMFAPMIGTIPFIGYVFEVDDTETTVEDFKTMLKNEANLRWNICTEADEMFVESLDSTVLFIMSPIAFEEAPAEEIMEEDMVDTEVGVEVETAIEEDVETEEPAEVE